MKRSILILLFALIGVCSAQAYDFKVGGIYYNRISDTSVEVTNDNYNPVYSGSVVIPSSVSYNRTYAVTGIGERAFQYCRGLTSVTIPESVTTIGAGAFNGCRGLTSVIIPDGVTSIGHNAFRCCSRLTSVTIPNSVTSIGGEAFYECSRLTSVTIGESVTSIGGEAFMNCSELTSVTIGESVTSIEYMAFMNCSRLTSVTSLTKTPPSCGWSVFSVHNTLFVPHGRKVAYQTAEEWKSFSIIEELPSLGTAMVTVTVNDTSMGRVTGGGDYDLDEEITLTAIPNEGYHFVKWDDENTDNPRTLTVTNDTTLMAIFAKDEDDPDNPDNPDEPSDPDDPDEPTANENPEADHFRVYAKDRIIHLSENRGSVQVYNVAGQCVYNGHATAIPVSQSGVYIVAVGSQRFKVPVK